MPSNLRDHKRPASGAPPDAAAAWTAVCELRRLARTAPLAFPVELDLAGARLTIAEGGAWRLDREPSAAVAELLDFYLPLALVPHGRSFVLAHLGQSLDGRIATAGGVSQWLTGPEDRRHTHRLRALADAVIVGAGTVRQDDPRLTVRECSGEHPVRVVLDPELGLDGDRRIFADGAAPTLVLAAADCAGARALGNAEIVTLPREGMQLAPRAIRAALTARGLHWLFIEGGGVTVSRFLAAGEIDRLQIVTAPVILGSGRPGLQLAEIDDLGNALRPRVRRLALGGDALVECIFHE